MKLNRKRIFRIHSWIGIKLSVLFFIVCFSGTLATLSHEMDWLFIPEMRANPGWANPGRANLGRATPQESRATRNQLVANVHAAFPDGKITYWETVEPYLCNILHVQKDEQRHYVFANPYTGAVQGSATLTFQRFFRDLHYYLFIPFQDGPFHRAGVCLSAADFPGDCAAVLQKVVPQVVPTHYQ